MCKTYSESQLHISNAQIVPWASEEQRSYHVSYKRQSTRISSITSKAICPFLWRSTPTTWKSCVYQQKDIKINILLTHWQVLSISRAATSYTIPGWGFEYQWKQWWCWSLVLYTQIIGVGESHCELVFTPGFLFQKLASQAFTVEITCLTSFHLQLSLTMTDKEQELFWPFRYRLLTSLMENVWSFW